VDDVWKQSRSGICPSGLTNAVRIFGRHLQLPHHNGRRICWRAPCRPPEALQHRARVLQLVRGGKCRAHTHTHIHTHTHTHTKFARAYIRTLSHVHAHALWCVQCFLGQTILESRSPCSPASTLLRMASSPERDASQCSTLQRLAKEREARASRIREICGRILNRRASDEAAGPRHLIVLAHGLMGGTTDLSFLKDCILELDPRALVLLSRSNQDKTTVWHGECTYAALNLSAACVCVCVCGAMSKHILSRTRSCSN